MADLIDFSFLIISLAIVGYILKDAFFFYRRYNTPYELQRGEDRIFSYISIAILVISFVWLGILTILIGEPGIIQSFQPFLDGFQKIIEMGLISEEQIAPSLFYFISFLYFFTIFVQVFILAFFIASALGIIFVYIDNKAICITFIGNPQIQRKFKRIICESEDFLYVESIDNFRNWEAIRKDSIQNITNISTHSRFQKFVKVHYENKLSKIPILNNRKYRAIIITILLIAILIIATLGPWISSRIIRVTLVILLIPIIILFLIHTLMD